MTDLTSYSYNMESAKKERRFARGRVTWAGGKILEAIHGNKDLDLCELDDLSRVFRRK